MAPLCSRPGRSRCRFAEFRRQGERGHVLSGIQATKNAESPGRQDQRCHVYHHRYVFRAPWHPSLFRPCGRHGASELRFVALAVMLYALTVYQMRARSIRLRTGAPYDDRLGPVSFSGFHLSSGRSSLTPCRLFCACVSLVCTALPTPKLV